LGKNYGRGRIVIVACLAMKLVQSVYKPYSSISVSSSGSTFCHSQAAHILRIGHGKAEKVKCFCTLRKRDKPL
jgi:hypothetical protein